MRTLDLRSLERSSWRLFQQDGLTDALLGMICLAAAVVAVLECAEVASGIQTAIMLGIPLSGVSTMIWIRKRYVKPRVGRVKYAASRLRKVRRLQAVLVLCVASTVALVVLTMVSDVLEIPWFTGVGALGAWISITAIIIPIGTLAFFLDSPRLLVYATLLSGAEYLHILVRLPDRVPYAAAYVYGAISLTALTVGITAYVRFVRRCPRQDAPPAADTDIARKEPDE